MSNENTPWIGIDLDGTLAAKDGEYVEGKIGWPIFKMCQFAKYQLGMGNRVKIYTARADNPVDVAAIKNWLLDEAGLPETRAEFNRLKSLGTPIEELEITNVKDRACVMLLDDLAYHVVENTGEIIGLGAITNSRHRETRLPKVVPFRVVR